MIDLDFVAPPAWWANALCRGIGTEPFFAGKSERATTEARRICSHCPVSVECLDEALADPSLVGIFGGTDEEERNAIR